MLKIIKSKIIVRKAFADFAERSVLVSMFTSPEYKNKVVIGYVRSNGLFSPYHIGSKKYIENVWNERFGD
jgi:hypothetical protein